MRLKRASLLLFALSVLLTFAGAVARVQSSGAPELSTYLLGGGISLLIAASIGLYLAPGETHRPRTGAETEDDRIQLPELQKRRRKNENLR